MKKLEIQAYSLEEAKLTAFKEGITVIQDATIFWRKSGSPVLTKDLDIFAANYLNKKEMFDFQGAGIIITISSGKENHKKFPFKLESSRRKGKCKLTRVVEIRTRENNIVVGLANTKTEAINKAKKLMSKYQEDLYGKTVYVTNDTDFELKYIPSTDTKLGQYIVFGVDEEDVRISKRRNRGFE